MPQPNSSRVSSQIALDCHGERPERAAVMKNAIDLAVVGGGLAGGLLALALRQRRPELRLALIEGGATLGGEHTWSFHDGDVSGEGAALLEPLIVHRWRSQNVAFPAHSRTLATGYNSITSARFNAVL